MYNSRLNDFFYSLFDNIFFISENESSLLLKSMFLSTEFFLVLAIFLYLCFVKNFNNNIGFFFFFSCFMFRVIFGIQWYYLSMV